MGQIMPGLIRTISGRLLRIKAHFFIPQSPHGVCCVASLHAHLIPFRLSSNNVCLYMAQPQVNTTLQAHANEDGLTRFLNSDS